MDRKLKEKIKKAAKGDLDAFQYICKRYEKKVFTFVYHLLGSHEAAEEVTQDTFLSVYWNLKNLKNIEKFEPWLFKIARNYVYQYSRKDYSKKEDFFEDGNGAKNGDVDMDYTPEEHLIKGEIGDEIKKAINSLDLKYREVFTLAVVEGYSYKEIAEMLGRSIQSVKTDIHRARVKLRKSLEKYLNEGKDEV